ncbi:potassium channel family protein [Rhabdothermincola salaria]|uniref:potassium channel family protein n=1 Tax=Rhabdothermincola salaria TaxID=2903142 RepID=UPI001E4936EF|nr:NAD-binding protein [Rhabdothermincola salaria]
MKSLGAIFSYLANPHGRRNLRVLGVLLVVFVIIVVLFSAVFHEIMEYEGQTHSWATAVYWTVVTMSTLGFGDITFESDVGRVFSVVVLLSGSVFILVLLPFSFIQFIFVPWMEARQRARAPRQLPRSTSGHVLLTGVGPIEESLVRRLDQAGIPYAAMIDDVDRALRLYDEGFRVMVGALDDPASFRAARVDQAALVVATEGDTTNTNVAFTVQEITHDVPIVATANRHASVDILEMAGCTEVLELGVMLGTALARRVLTPGGRSVVIGEFGDLLIAEAATPRTLVGSTLLESNIRPLTGLTVAGVWDRGELAVARPNAVFEVHDAIVLAGNRAQLDRWDEHFGESDILDAPVVIIGGGRVGRAAGATLAAAGIPHRIVEQLPERVRDPSVYVVGDAADLTVLEEAGIHQSRAAIITTHDDDVNVYLTIYCRKLRPEMQIISRARLDRNVSTLHRAGADSVLSYASTGANAIWNVLTPDNTLQLADGLDVFRVPVPRRLMARTISEARVRERSGCTVVAVAVTAGHFEPAQPDTVMVEGCDLLLIGDEESEARFFATFVEAGRS